MSALGPALYLLYAQANVIVSNQEVTVEVGFQGISLCFCPNRLHISVQSGLLRMGAGLSS